MRVLRPIVRPAFGDLARSVADLDTDNTGAISSLDFNVLLMANNRIRIALQREHELLYHSDGRIALTAFYAGDVSAVQSCAFSQFFLGPAILLSETLNI